MNIKNVIKNKEFYLFIIKILMFIFFIIILTLWVISILNKFLDDLNGLKSKINSQKTTLDKNINEFNNNTYTLFSFVKSFDKLIDFDYKYQSNYSIYDKNNLLLAKIIPEKFTSNKKYKTNDIEVLSLINIEDQDYFNRDTLINPKSLFRAIYQTLQWNKQWWSGISQQLVKNFIIKWEIVWIKRKIQEIFYVYNLEKKYSKIELINLYLNSISYWKNVFWIQQAWEVFLNKKDLNIMDWFFLNSMLKQPTYYFSNQSELKERTKYYYKKFCKLNICDWDLNKNLTYIDKLNLNYNIKNERYWNDYIIDMVIKNINKENILKNNIIVTNYKKNQNEDFLNNEINKKMKNTCIKYNLCDLWIVVLNKNSEIEYLYSWDYKNSQVNVLTSNLQPWSTLKPFIYSKFLEIKNKNSTNIDFSNLKTCIDWWCPSNWNNKESNSVSLNTALNLSYNIPVVHITKNLWLNKIIDLLGSLNLFDTKEKYWPSIILWWYNLEPIKLANAYNIFLNKWNFRKFNIIYKYTNNYWWEELNEFENSEIKQIFNGDYIKNVSSVLKNNWFNSNYSIKTWTTQNFKEEFIIWFNNDRVILMWWWNRDWSETKHWVYAITKIWEYFNLVDSYIK